jgi:hypothetical protein
MSGNVSETNILKYEPKSPAAKSVEDLIGKISSAKDQWDTYGAALALSYKTAYEQHTKTLKELELKFREESSDLFYYILAAFVAGSSGGIAGMLMAPIVNRAGIYIAELTRRAYKAKLITVKTAYKVKFATQTSQKIVLEGTKEVGVKAAEKLEIEKFFAPAPPKPEAGTFKPPETDPHKFDLVKRTEIGIYASLLKENVRRFQLVTDKGYLEPKSAQDFYASYLAESFLADQPTSEQIAAAASEKAQNQAEIAMWIAWASAMKTEYWKIRLEGIQHIDRGTDYNDFREVSKFDPVFDRLAHLGVGRLVGMPYTVSKEWRDLTNGFNGQVLSIPKLQQLGNKTEDRFLKRVDNIVRQRTMTLSDFEAIAGTKLA